MIGSGLYADNTAGAAAATGNGDEILKFCMSFLVVELMRQGQTPAQACQQTIDRFLELHPESSDEDINLIALSPSGASSVRRPSVKLSPMPFSMAAVANLSKSANSVGDRGPVAPGDFI